MSNLLRNASGQTRLDNGGTQERTGGSLRPSSPTLQVSRSPAYFSHPPARRLRRSAGPGDKFEVGSTPDRLAGLAMCGKCPQLSIARQAEEGRRATVTGRRGDLDDVLNTYEDGAGLLLDLMFSQVSGGLRGCFIDILLFFEANPHKRWIGHTLCFCNSNPRRLPNDRRHCLIFCEASLGSVGCWHSNGRRHRTPTTS